MRYVIVTPVRDEAPHVGTMIDSVLAQSLQPLRWVIVDDGSSDSTPEIVARKTRGIDWVTVIGATTSHRRNLGVAEVVAFQRGLESVEHKDWDYVVKLDADVQLPSDYFEKLLARMTVDESWGIASGVYLELVGERWQQVEMPPYHAAGASKVVRSSCFKAIGGFVAEKGWDTVDEIRAQMTGWRTGHFRDLQFHHLKHEGSAMGSLETHRFHGEIYYRTGGGLIFLIAKSLRRMWTGKPLLIGGLAMLRGYLTPLLARAPRLVSTAEARFYRRMLHRRLMHSLFRRRMNNNFSD